MGMAFAIVESSCSVSIAVSAKGLEHFVTFTFVRSSIFVASARNTFLLNYDRYYKLYDFIKMVNNYPGLGILCSRNLI